MSIEAMKLALAALETCRKKSVSVSGWSVKDITPKNVTAAIAALRTAIQQAEAQQPAPGVPRGAVNLGAHSLASELAQAVAQDDDDPEGHDMSAGLFGPTVSAWLRKVAADFLSHPAPGEPVTAVKSIHVSQGALKCTNGTQNTLLLQQEVGAVGDTKTPENGFQGPLAQDLSTKAGASQVEPFAHICIVNTKDAGPTKFFTAPSDPRAIPVYTHPAQGVPDGYVLMPVEPTQEMLQAGNTELIYAAMLAAAQAQKGQP